MPDNNNSPLPLGEGPGVRAASGVRAAQSLRAGHIKARPNPYAQVALTYIRRPLASCRGWLMATFALLVFGIVVLSALFGNRHETSPPDIFPYVILSWLPFLLLVVHIKEQFADSRARLTPGFRRVHVAVAAAAVLLFAVLLPAGLTLLAGWRSVGLVAITLVLFDVIFWQAAFNASWPTWLIVAAFIGMTREPARIALGEFVSGKYESQAVAMLLVGAAIAWQGMRRLVRLTEDDPKSYRRMQWDQSGRFQMTGQAPAEDGSLGQRLRNWAMDRDMSTLTRHARNAPASWWSRICRWQVGMTTPFTFWGFCIIIFVNLHIMAWFMAGTLRPDSMTALAPGAIMLLMIPGFILFGQLIGRQPMLARELLLPATRRDYVRQLGLAAALIHFRLGGGMVAAVALWWLLNVREPLQIGLIVRVLFFIAVTQVLIFGLLVWLASIRSRVLAIVAFIVAFMGLELIGSLYLTAPGPLPEPLPLLAGAILAASGLLFIWKGYRRWLAADFD